MLHNVGEVARVVGVTVVHRAAVKVEVIGVIEPGAAAAVAVAAGKTIGVIATEATVQSAASRSPAAIEINGDPHRLDLAPPWLRQARRRGLRFVVSVDAHSVRGFDHLELAVRMARRAGIRRDEVLNTLPAPAFRAAVRP